LSLKFQFFITYAVLGAIMPLLPIFLMEEKNFTEQQVSFAFSFSAIGLVITPMLMTLLADLRYQSRRIIACTLSVAAAMLCALYFSDGVALTLLCYSLFSLSYTPVFSLLDGLFFSEKRQRELEDKPTGVYGHIRLWGTIGYIIPSLGLFFILRHSQLGGALLFCAIAFCIAAIIATFFLPAPPPRASSKKSGLPSLQALKALVSPDARWFTIGLCFALLGVPAYYMFFSPYLIDIGVHKKWIPIIINIGVFFEIFYIQQLERIRRVLRLKGIMIAGFTAMGLRLLLLALFPSVITAVATQLLHGLEILALIVVPVMYLDRIASDGFRNSIQGVYSMTILSSTRIIGALAAGKIATHNLTHAFYWAAALAFTGAIILALKFKPIPSREAEF
jgi:PPP family 3-phenylpropionic acid transporter